HLAARAAVAAVRIARRGAARAGVHALAAARAVTRRFARVEVLVTITAAAAAREGLAADDRCVLAVLARRAAGALAGAPAHALEAEERRVRVDDVARLPVAVVRARRVGADEDHVGDRHFGDEVVRAHGHVLVVTAYAVVEAAVDGHGVAGGRVRVALPRARVA